MAKKPADKWQFGDFQTPDELARKVVDTLIRNHGAKPQLIIEPTCGKGAFIRAALRTFPASRIIGFDINSDYVRIANDSIAECDVHRKVSIEQGDFFEVDWNSLIDSENGPIMVLGNPPWVTSSELGMLNSSNMPVKSNFQNRRGIEAITGSGNFDISEWMLLQHAKWLSKKEGTIALLCKHSVARKVMAQVRKQCRFFGHIYPVDAKTYFGASVEACLFVMTTGKADADYEVYADLDSEEPVSLIGERDGFVVNNTGAYEKWRHLLGQDMRYIWRSGVKHDCSKIMELEPHEDGFVNGSGEFVQLESEYLYPLLKSSDVGNSRTDGFRKVVIVPQRSVGEETVYIKDVAPKTWKYLNSHKAVFSKRRSAIYRGKPPFSVFGVGEYTFKGWKIAISGLYKKLNFCIVGPMNGKPVIFDDTVNFLACDSEEEAAFLKCLLTSAPATEFISAMVFWGEKRPVTAKLLRRLCLRSIAEELGLLDEYKRFAKNTAHKRFGQLELGIAEDNNAYFSESDIRQ